MTSEAFSSNHTVLTLVMDMPEVYSILLGVGEKAGHLTIKCHDGRVFGFALGGYDWVSQRDLIVRSIEDAIRETN